MPTLYGYFVYISGVARLLAQDSGIQLDEKRLADDVHTLLAIETEIAVVWNLCLNEFILGKNTKKNFQHKRSPEDERDPLSSHHLYSLKELTFLAPNVRNFAAAESYR